MPDPVTTLYISQIALPDGNTYNIKDLYAWDMIETLIAGALSFVRSTNAGNTPEGVQWTDGSTVITGTLVASADTKGKIYLVPSKNASGKDIYDEYVTINTGTEQSPTYAWEKLGDTDISLDDLGALAFKDSVTLNKSTDVALGESTTFTNASSAVSFTGGTNDTFVKSYPGVKSKLETTTIKGVGSDVTFDAVGSATDITTTYVSFGTDATASLIETESKTATNTVLGTAEKVNKVSAAASKTVAKVAATATDVSYIGNANTSGVLETATVAAGSEVLTIGRVTITQGSVTGTNGTETISQVTIGSEVTVPQVTSNDPVGVNSVKTNTDVTVPVISSHENRTASKVTTASKTAATSASSATRVATGSLRDNETVGSQIMTGLGEATTASAVTNIGTGTAAAQTITVGTNDKVTVLDNSTNITVA